MGEHQAFANRAATTAAVLHHYRVNTATKSVDVDTATVATRDQTGHVNVRSHVRVRVSHHVKQKAKAILVNGSRLVTEVGVEMGLHELIVLIMTVL